MSQAQYNECVAALPNGVDLYGDCDYLYPYPALGPRPQEKGIWERFQEWASKEENQTVVLMGAAVIALMLTRR